MLGKIEQAVDRAVELGRLGGGSRRSDRSGDGRRPTAAGAPGTDRHDRQRLHGPPHGRSAATTAAGCARRAHRRRGRDRQCRVLRGAAARRRADRDQLTLVAREAKRLAALGSEVAETLARRGEPMDVRTARSMDAVRDADLVLILTSASDALLRGEHLKRGAVVLDDTQPRNTDPALATERPDVLVVDGGVAEIPGIDVRGDIGLPRGLAYACLCETMLMALDGPPRTLRRGRGRRPRPANAGRGPPARPPGLHPRRARALVRAARPLAFGRSGARGWAGPDGHRGAGARRRLHRPCGLPVACGARSPGPRTHGYGSRWSRPAGRTPSTAGPPRS